MTSPTTIIGCPSCGDELEPRYLANGVFYEGDQQYVCDACLDAEYRQCPRCGRWVHKDEYISGVCDYGCFDEWRFEE